jgi:hypothetical protein
MSYKLERNDVMKQIRFDEISMGLIGGADRTLRVSEYRGTYSIRPSTRGVCVKGEALGTLQAAYGGVLAVVDFDLPEGTFGLKRSRYGWFNLVAGDDSLPRIDVTPVNVQADEISA